MPDDSIVSDQANKRLLREGQEAGECPRRRFLLQQPCPVLFVASAGKRNESNQFNEVIPASFDLPNTITVGAVDQAGDEAAFTSFGKVDLYANGYAVESVVPGGEKYRWSGTSMAAPQVVNLAAKLLAAYPRLSVAEVKKLIVDGADAKDVSGGRMIRLLNEARSFELARGAQR